MPSRQISPQSFDEILSDLGDDPAIPDPHGIRKPIGPKPPFSSTTSRPNTSLNNESLIHGLPLDGIKKFGPFLGFGIALALIAFCLFIAFEAVKSSQQVHLDTSQKQLEELKKELASLRQELLEIEDSLYESIDELEVSIHSFKESKPITATKPKPQATLFESELRRWRYLGLSQIGASQQAFFYNGKRTVMFEKGSILLGDWRLGNLDSETATLIHPQGKSLILKPIKIE